MQTVRTVSLHLQRLINFFLQNFLFKSEGYLGNFCIFAVAKSFPKRETFCGNKTEKLSKTENFQLH